jgi:uncharacterized protein (DUF362 family)/ferredoxin
MSDYAFSAGKVTVLDAWTVAQVREAMDRILRDYGSALPKNRSARIVIKPNLNNDLSALTGNSTDLRVLAGLLGGLQELGYTNLALADGPNVGVERRGISVFRRLRVDRLAEKFKVDLINLNHDDGEALELEGGACPRIARCLTSADFVICVPTVKTHAEAGMSIACKNWVGIVCGQDKRQMHYALGPNIARLVEHFPPDLVIIDGLIGMEGNGPGDGDPIRLGFIAAGTNPWLCDLVVCRLVGFPWERVTYLRYAVEHSIIPPGLPAEVAESVSASSRIKPAPERNILAETSDMRSLFWLKKLLRPLTGRKPVADLAYRAGIIQDVYDLKDDTISGVHRVETDCGTCEACAEVCPTELPLASIGVEQDPDKCIRCLYCWWRCPEGGIELIGEPEFMTRQIDRYKTQVEEL